MEVDNTYSSGPQKEPGRRVTSGDTSCERRISSEIVSSDSATNIMDTPVIVVNGGGDARTSNNSVTPLDKLPQDETHAGSHHQRLSVGNAKYDHQRISASECGPGGGDPGVNK